MHKGISSPQNPEEVTEDVADDYEMNENDEKADNTHTDDMERESKRVRSNPADEKGSSNKPEDNNSDMSVNEDESDDEEEKKTKVVELEWILFLSLFFSYVKHLFRLIIHCIKCIKWENGIRLIDYYILHYV